MRLAMVLMSGLLLTSVASAEPPATVQIEVNFLLGYIERSGCEFYRNGIWHDSKTTQAHLRDKYNYLVARNLISTTEDFIERAATKSSLSRLPYEVRCNGGATVTSNYWLREELRVFGLFRARLKQRRVRLQRWTARANDAA